MTRTKKACFFGNCHVGVFFPGKPRQNLNLGNMLKVCIIATYFVLIFKDSPATSLQGGHGRDKGSWMGHSKLQGTKKRAFGKYSFFAVIGRGICGTYHSLEGFCYNFINTDFFYILNSGHGRDVILTQANFLNLKLSKIIFSLILTQDITSDHC